MFALIRYDLSESRPVEPRGGCVGATDETRRTVLLGVCLPAFLASSRSFISVCNPLSVAAV